MRIFSSACHDCSPGSPVPGGRFMAVAALVCSLASGCAHFGVVSPSAQPEKPASSAPDKKNPDAEFLLLTLEAFSKADAVGKAGIYEATSTAAVLDSTAIHRLTLALLKAIPGHHGYNLDSAQQLLRAVLSDPAKLPPGAAYLAGVYLDKIVEQRRLNSQLVLLKAELSEAQKKLEALTEIEREVETQPQDVNGDSLPSSADVPVMAPDNGGPESGR